MNNELKRIFEANYSEKVEILPVNTDRGSCYSINLMNNNQIKGLRYENIGHAE